MKEILDKLKSLYGISASLGVCIPGYTFFTSYAPPVFKSICLVTSALCLAFLIFSLKGSRKKPPVKKAMFRIVLSFLLLLLYLFFFSFTTTRFNSDNVLQVGFGNMKWSLTGGAVKMIAAGSCPATDNTTLLECAGFAEKNISRIWRPWSVYTAGYMLILLFTVSSVLWTMGWAQLANRRLD